MNAPLAGAATLETPFSAEAVVIDLTESIVRCMHGGVVVEWPTTVGYLDSESSDPRQIVAGEPIARSLASNPLTGVRLVPTLVDIPFVLLNRRPHTVDDLLTRLLAPALPAGGSGDHEIVVTYPSAWGRPRTAVLQTAAARLGSHCSLVPRAITLAKGLVNPNGQTAGVIETQSSSVDISVLANRADAWILLESRRVHAQTGVPLTEVGVKVARELSDMLRDNLGKESCSSALDALVIDAPPRLASAIVEQIGKDDPSFNRIIPASRDAAIRGLMAPLQPTAPPPPAQQQPAAGPPPQPLSQQTPSPPPPQQTLPPPSPPLYAQRPAPTVDERPYASDDEEDSDYWTPGAARSIESAFAEPQRRVSPVVWIGVAAALVIILAVTGIIWSTSGSDKGGNQTTTPQPAAQAGPVKTVTPSVGPTAQPTTAPDGGSQLVNVPDPNAPDTVLFSFELPASWQETSASVCADAQQRSFRSAPLFFHDPQGQCVEVAISYEALKAEGNLHTVGNDFQKYMETHPGDFQNLKIAEIVSGKSVDSYQQPSRSADWYIYIAPHNDTPLAVSVGCRNEARDHACEQVVRTLDVRQ